MIVEDTHYYVVDGNDYGISVFDMAGLRVRELRPNDEPDPKPVTAADIEIARKRFVRNALPQFELGAVFDRMPIPETFPLYGWGGARDLTLLRASQAGDLWVLNYGGVRDAQPIWTVFGKDGSIKERVRAPEELDLLDATHEVAVVLRWDEEDVETVELRRILW